MSATKNCIFCKDVCPLRNVILFKEKTIEKCRIILAARERRGLECNNLNFSEENCENKGYHSQCYRHFTAYKIQDTDSGKTNNKKIDIPIPESYDDDALPMHDASSQQSKSRSAPRPRAKSQRISTTRCSYKGCMNKMNRGPGKVNNIKFYTFPYKNTERCKEWIRRAGNSELFKLKTHQCHRILLCESHFEEKAFANETHQRLNRNALPKHFLGLPSPEREVGVETINNLPSENFTNSYLDDKPLKNLIPPLFRKADEPHRSYRRIKRERPKPVEETSNDFDASIDEIKIENDISDEAVDQKINLIENYENSLLSQSEPSVVSETFASEDADRSCSSSSMDEKNLMFVDVGKVLKHKDDSSAESSSKKEDTFDCFGKYIASLLRALPIQKSLQLQQDIVSLVLNAQNSNDAQ